MNYSTSVAADLAAQTIGCRVAFKWLGQSRAIDENQQNAAAELFSADVDALRTSKRLIGSDCLELKALTAIRGNIRAGWLAATLPYTEPGIRLLKREHLAEFQATMSGQREQLETAAAALQAVRADILNDARRRLGELFNRADYPENLVDCFGFSFDFPALTPPDFLAELDPELFQREQSRVRAQFERAAELAESAFADELAKMTERITETLRPGVDGKPRIFRDSMVENLADFFQRFRRLSIGSSEQLENLIADAERAAAGITPAALRTVPEVRAQFAANMGAIAERLNSETIARPGRVIRFNRADSAADPQPEPEQPASAAPRWSFDTGVSSWEQPASAAPAVETVNQAIEPAAPIAAEPVAVVSADIAAAFGLVGNPAVIVVPEPEPAAAPIPPEWGNQEQRAAVPVVIVNGTARRASSSEPATEPAPAVQEQPEPPRVFRLDFGGGRVETLAVPELVAAG